MAIYENNLDYLKYVPHAKVDLSVSDPHCSGNIADFIPRLMEFKLDCLDLDFSFTNTELFERIIRYLNSETLPNSLKLHVFSQNQMEAVLKSINENVSKPKLIQIVLHAEALIKLKDMIYKFQ
mmetsp:Transcript_10033/g.8831  ORF Transcript_10033/g.8831 Transcript_10033/m.8831 type:complete len:123 (+) Transcript_10033:375-743(+)